MTKYLLDEFEDATSMQYAIGTVQLLFSPKLSSVSSGIKADERYPGIYEWDRVDISDDNKDAASLSFKNWVPSKPLSDVSHKYFLLTAAPTGLGCGVMSVGIGDPNNGRLVLTKISSQYTVILQVD